MHHAPSRPRDGLTFALEALAEELRSEELYRRDGVASRTLIRTPDLRILLVTLAAGKALAEHQARATASLQTLSGQVRVQLPDRPAELTAGGLLVLGGGLPHDVSAVTASVLLLTLGGVPVASE